VFHHRPHQQQQHLYVKRALTLELDVDRVGILTDGAHVLVGTNATSVDLFRVDAILRVQVLHFAGREDAVDAAVRDLLRAKRSHQSHALLLSRELQEVRAFAHDRRTTSRHFKDLFFLRFPRQDVELFNLMILREREREENFSLKQNILNKIKGRKERERSAILLCAHRSISNSIRALAKRFSSNECTIR
tara:strand:- start:5455 stop:6024 length:570 start_codon:yes stop_codon:yes gene_type:complete